MVRGVSDELRRHRAALQKAPSSASNAIDLYKIDLPANIATEMPEWLAEAMKQGLDDTFSHSYWEAINETTRNDIQRLLSRGLEEGYSIRTLANAISSLSTEYSRARATNVARTEATGAMNNGHQIGIQKVGEALKMPMGKEWLSVLGSTTRPTHADADGQMVEASAMFNVGGYDARYPGDPMLPAEERCQCQCTIISSIMMGDEIVEQEVSGDEIALEE